KLAYTGGELSLRVRRGARNCHAITIYRYVADRSDRWADDLRRSDCDRIAGHSGDRAVVVFGGGDWHVDRVMGRLSKVTLQLLVPNAIFCGCGNLPSSRTATSTIDPADADVEPLTVTDDPLAEMAVIDTEGGGFSVKACALKKAHCNSLALGPVGSANCPLLSPTQ